MKGKGLIKPSMRKHTRLPLKAEQLPLPGMPEAIPEQLRVPLPGAYKTEYAPDFTKRLARKIREEIVGKAN